MRSLAIALLVVLVQSVALAADLRELRMATLTLQVPPTWHFTGSGERAEGKGPDGENVIASYRKMKADAPSDAIEYHWRVVRGFAADKMPGLASKYGTVLRAVTETHLPEGRVQFSAVSQTQRMLRDYYFLQYLFGSSRAMIYLTVEGYGNAEDAAARFESVLATQRWDE